MNKLWIERKRESDSSYQGGAFNSLSIDSNFQRDRARIIHSASFRRLQSKTQVLSLGESDFYRTRLTHSLEVAQIGSSICNHLYDKYSEVSFMLPSMSLIEGICLAHDIGHPPFGHGGEIALNKIMKDYGGFEGNGQTLRIISKLGEYSPEHGLDLTRRSMLGVLKYPALHKDVCNYGSKIKPPKCIHDEEAGVLHWILNFLDPSDVEEFKSIDFKINEKGEREGHGKTKHKAFDTSIMEIADDIAYGVHDLEDALALQLVNREQWMTEIYSAAREIPECGEVIKGSFSLTEIVDFCNEKLFSGSNKDRKHAISRLVGYFVNHVEVYKKEIFICNELDWNARLIYPAEFFLKLLKNFVLKHVIKRHQVQALEYKGQVMIEKLFSVLMENSEKLLPKSDYEKYQSSDNKHRVVCDYIAGMTDIHATKVYSRIFIPNVGSLFER